MTSYAASSPADEGEGLNYRQRLALLVPAFLLFYVLIVFPLMYAGGTVSADLATVPQTTNENYALNRFFFPGLFALGVLLFLAERPRLAAGSGVVIGALLIFWGFCGLSAAWALVPGRTVSQFILISITVVAAGLSGLVGGSMERSLRAAFWVAALTLVLNLASVLLTPPTPIGHEGIYSHKNVLGSVSAITFLFAIWGAGQDRSRLQRYAGLVMIPIALFVLWKSESKTALGFAIITPVLAAIFFFARRYLRIALPVLLVLAVIFSLALAVVVGWLGYTAGHISELISGDPTFTGRTEIWAFAADRIAERPLLGYGFRSFWQIGDASPALHGPPGFLRVAPNGHNGYIDLVLQIGFIGLGLFLVLLLAVAGRISRLIDARPWLGFFCTSLVVYIVLHNLLESTWFELVDVNQILFLVLMFTALGDREVFG